MARPDLQLEDLRAGDLWTFLAVQRVGSVTAAAREMAVTPSQVSKALARLERQLDGKLVTRSSRGVALTPLGRRVLPDIEDAAGRLRKLRRSDEAREIELTVAGASYLVATFLPAIATCTPLLRARGLEIPPALVRAYAAENIFDIALLGSGTEKLPSSWVSERVGTLRKRVYATPEVASSLGPMPISPDKLRDQPFICPIYVVGGRFVIADDDCPLSMSQRRFGHETQTAAVALELASRTGQLVFAPSIAAARHVAAGTLVDVRVRGWKVEEPLFIIFNTDRVLSRVRTAAVKAVRSVMDSLQPRDPKTS